MIKLKQQFPHYLQLIRFDRPIGFLLLLWPTLWSLWLAAQGWPQTKNLIIFFLGCFLMRSAGCVINDYADRNLDGHVARTKTRPLVTGTVSVKEAQILFVIICFVAFALVLLTNQMTILLSFGGLALASTYPFMKRYTQMPQLVLGIAFSWGIIMAYTAERNELSGDIWLLFVATVLWTIVYDTFYAMIDRDDDLKIGIKSTAILFGDLDKKITFLLQFVVIVLLLIVGIRFGLGAWYFFGIFVASTQFLYQQYLIHDRNKEKCLQAFLNNHWVGATVFSGIFLDFQFG